MSTQASVISTAIINAATSQYLCEFTADDGTVYCMAHEAASDVNQASMLAGLVPHVDEMWAAQEFEAQLP
jgi:hypothetical protein